MDSYYGNEHEDIVYEMNKYEREKKLSRLKKTSKRVVLGIYVSVSLGAVAGLAYANWGLKTEVKQLKKEYNIAVAALNNITNEYDEAVNSIYTNNYEKNENKVSADETAKDYLHVYDNWKTGDETVEYMGVKIPWYLNLVNYENPIDDDFSVDLKDVHNVYVFDARASDALDKMMADAEECGLSPIICSSYRSLEKQSTLFYDCLYRIMAQGYCYEDAFKMAKRTNATPGNSEHHLGLAVDIMAKGYGILDQGLENTEEFKWLKDNCSKYGFILRYPEGKFEITGIEYEPWHFRYVGEAAAGYITENNLTLEEYLEEYVDVMN